MSKTLGKFITIDGVTITLDGNGALQAVVDTSAKRMEFAAANLSDPTFSPWPITVNAPIDFSGSTSVRGFDDTVDSGVGVDAITVPGNVKLGIRWKAAVDPGATKGVVFKLYKAPLFGTWDTGTVLSTATCTDDSENYNEWAITLTAGSYQFEIIRAPLESGDDLVGDAQVAIISFEAI